MKIYKEYAIHPDVFTDIGRFNHVFDMLGWDDGRLVANAPGNWRNVVFNRFKDSSPIQKKRIEERLKRAKEDFLVPRSEAVASSHEEVFPIINEEHLRHPFDGILCEGETCEENRMLGYGDLSKDHPLWTNSTPPVRRDVSNMTEAVKLLLSASNYIIFVDPYFNPTRIAFSDLFRRMLRVVFLESRFGVCGKEVEIHTSTKEKPDNYVDFFKEKTAGLIPRGCTVKLKLLDRRGRGERFHNRYILTRKAGISLGQGLQTGSHGATETDTIQRLTREEANLRWKQHAGEIETYLQIGEPIIVQGTWNV